MELHWADWMAAEALEARGTLHRVATGITPSGPIHLGNIREVMTADLVYRGLRSKDIDPDFIYIADSFDPLRKVYPFLPESYKEYIGKPLAHVPDPQGCCDNYAEHFLQPFLCALEDLGIKPRVLRADRLYKEGVYTDVITEAMSGREKISAILSEVSGREMPPNWSPLNALCRQCGRLSGTTITGFRPERHQVDYTCDCGYEGTADYSIGEAKLVWRVDWPARWKALGVTMEPFGKDHAAPGGSYDTGIRISREIFGYEPPFPMVYEWIYLKGQGAMSSSTGVAVSIEDMLELLPPQVVRYLIARARPEKHIEFDPGQALINLLEEYDKLERIHFGEEPADEESASQAGRLYSMSQPDGEGAARQIRIPFRHMVVSAQIARGSFGRLKEVLIRSGYGQAVQDEDRVRREMEYALVWLRKYAPPAFVFEVREELPEGVAALDAAQRQALLQMAESLSGCDPDARELENMLYTVAGEAGLKSTQLFQAVYTAILGQKSGPRAAPFILSLEREFVIERLRQAAAARSE
ncbi:MAG: lysine--tRNA ligase [bacterium]|nr:lysine--tRNA ligase [bacterium]